MLAESRTGEARKGLAPCTWCQLVGLTSHSGTQRLAAHDSAVAARHVWRGQSARDRDHVDIYRVEPSIIAAGIY